VVLTQLRRRGASRPPVTTLSQTLKLQQTVFRSLQYCLRVPSANARNTDPQLDSSQVSSIPEAILKVGAEKRRPREKKYPDHQCTLSMSSR